MEIKYTVEMDVPQEFLDNLKANPAGLTIDDLVQMKIETALVPKPCSVVLVYRADEGKKAIDLFRICPVCAHPWVLHFDMLKKEPARMSDGSMAPREILADPTPTNCSECASQKQSCGEALKVK